jgi:hypothetical protein
LGVKYATAFFTYNKPEPTGPTEPRGGVSSICLLITCGGGGRENGMGVREEYDVFVLPCKTGNLAALALAFANHLEKIWKLIEI